MLYRDWDNWIRGGFCQQLKKMAMFSEEQLDDVVQQFYADILGKGLKFFTAYNQPEHKTPEAGYKSWLSVCIRHAAINHARKLKTNLFVSIVEEDRRERSEYIFKAEIPVNCISALKQEQQNESSDIEHLMERLQLCLHDEGERVMLVCSLLCKGMSPTEIALHLARERTQEEGVVFDELDEMEQQRLLSQCKPLVSQYRARIQDRATEFNMFSMKSVERATCRIFGIQRIELFSRPWQFVLWYCRKYGIATVSELVERYSEKMDDQVALESQIRGIVSCWGKLPASKQAEIQALEARI